MDGMGMGEDYKELAYLILEAEKSGDLQSANCLQ